MEEYLIYIVLTVGLLLLGLLAGGANERRHFRRLARGEKALSHIGVCNLKTVSSPETVARSELVLGHVVIATDTFKSWLTGLRNLVGGELGAARKLMIRARREATLRMMERAEEIGAREVWNVRYGFCSVSMMRGRSGAMQVEILAWGTAVTRS